MSGIGKIREERKCNISQIVSEYRLSSTLYHQRKPPMYLLIHIIRITKKEFSVLQDFNAYVNGIHNNRLNPKDPAVASSQWVR